VVARNKGLLTALGHAVTTVHKPEEDPRSAHPIYQFWHGHITSLISRERSDLDAELLAHILLAALHSDPILRMLEQGDDQRLADSLCTRVTALLNASADGTETRNGRPPNPPRGSEYPAARRREPKVGRAQSIDVD